MQTRIISLSTKLVAILIAIMSSNIALAQSGSLQKIKARMDWVPTGIYSAFYYAQQRGYYAREGLSVEVLPGQGSNATLDALLRKDVDFGFVSCWATAVGISKRRDVVSVATFTGRVGFAFIFPADAGIKTLKDFAGKTIVVSAGGFDTQIYPAVLASNGLPANLMKEVNVEPAQKSGTYIRGQADVVNTHYAAALPSISKQRPSGYIPWASVGFSLPDFCIEVTRERLEKEPQLVEKFLRATFAAAADAAKKPDDAAAAAVELNPLMDRKTAEQEWTLMTELFYSDDTKGCPHGWHSASDWTKGLENLQKFGGLEGPISDHSKFYTNKFFVCNK